MNLPVQQLVRRDDFMAACREFVRTQGAIQHGWHWKEQLGYCELERVHYCPQHILAQQQQQQDDHPVQQLNNMGNEMEESIEDIDPFQISTANGTYLPGDCGTSSSSSNNEIPLYFKYHIVYSEAYRVPVLYFNAYNMKDSSLLSVNQILRFISHKNSGNALLPSDVNPYTFITQGEHPILSTIFYYVHPCETANVMQIVTASAQWQQNADLQLPNYITSWLSFIGRIIFLDIPLSYLNSS